MSKVIRSAEVDIEVPFHDVDAMEVVWHGHYVKYLEIARCELLRAFNYDYPQMAESGYIWPIVDMRLKYVDSALFGQVIKVQANLVEYENRLKIEYLVRNKGSDKVLTKAYTVQVAVCIESREMQFESPAIVRENLGV